MRIIYIFLVISISSFAQVTFSIEDLEYSNESIISMPIYVEQFNDIISFQGTIEFDPTILAFNSYQNTTRFQTPGQYQPRQSLQQQGQFRPLALPAPPGRGAHAGRGR